VVKNEARIELTGWLNNVSDFDWGRALKVSVDVRKQNHQGEVGNRRQKLPTMSPQITGHRWRV
jgi:hypothetical protein